MDLAAFANAQGLDGWKLITTRDPVERVALTALAWKTAQARRQVAALQAGVDADTLIERMADGGG